jgi:branched-subunit amino acid aminotransferase/4-amino-4-deoxychorismate lyase
LTLFENWYVNPLFGSGETPNKEPNQNVLIVFADVSQAVSYTVKREAWAALINLNEHQKRLHCSANSFYIKMSHERQWY